MERCQLMRVVVVIAACVMTASADLNDPQVVALETSMLQVEERLLAVPIENASELKEKAAQKHTRELSRKKAQKEGQVDSTKPAAAKALEPRKAPEPSKKAPQPEKKAPQPEKKAPEPEKKAPEPVKKAPEPEKKAPEPKKKGEKPAANVVKAETVKAKKAKAGIIAKLKKEPEKVHITNEKLQKAKQALVASSPLPKPAPEAARPKITASKAALPKPQQEAAENEHIVKLRKTIDVFENKVQKTLLETEQKITHNTATIQTEHQKLDSDSKTLKKIERMSVQAQKLEDKLEKPASAMELLDTLLLEMGETNVTEADLSAQLAQKKSELAADLDKLHAQLKKKKAIGLEDAEEKAAELADKEKEAAEKASKEAKAQAEKKAAGQREKFIAAEIEKAKKAANLKIVNPLEQQLQEKKAHWEELKQTAAGDHQKAVAYLQGAAVAAQKDAGTDSTPGDDTIAEDDARADAASSLFRFSSKQAAEAHTAYLRVKTEYDAIQAKLIAENKKNIEAAGEKAAEEAGPDFDVAAKAQAKKQAEAAAKDAKAKVDDAKKEVAKIDKAQDASEASAACTKCIDACGTTECKKWCKQSKWCTKPPQQNDSTPAKKPEVAKPKVSKAPEATKAPEAAKADKAKAPGDDAVADPSA